MHRVSKTVQFFWSDNRHIFINFSKFRHTDDEKLKQC